MQRKLDILMILILVLSFITLLAGDVVETNAKYISSADSNTNIKVATWEFKLNGNTTSTTNINLEETISPDNKYSTTSVIPGTNGMIPIYIDSTNSKVALDYQVILNVESVPTNLKFYTDETYQTEYTNINSFIGLNDTKTRTHNIYWKWNFTQDNESTNWSNQNIIVNIEVIASQRIAGDAS